MIKIEIAERNRDVVLAADLKYGAVPDLQSKILTLEADIERDRAMDNNPLVSQILGFCFERRFRVFG